MSFEEKFARAELSGQDGVFERIDETHPVGIFLGLEGNQRAILVVCPKRPPQPPSLASIAVEVRTRQSGEWALVLRLVRPELKGLFTRLVEDLDGATRQRPDDPGDVVIARLARWQRLLSRGTPNVLDDEALCGLLGEIEFLLSEAIPAVGPRAAVAAWRGPYDSPKDFVFNSAEVEVKSVHRQRDRLTVSSLEQLTDAGLPLHLWCHVVELTLTTAGDPSGVPALVSRVRAAVSQDAEASEGLELSLRAAGWEDRIEYETRGVRFGATTCYAVGAGFPRLQRGSVAGAIAGCKYELTIDELRPFKVATWRSAEERDGG
ncbi:MAG: PD-(D/E)XK motif protein [Planctomycetes bacterium]|nr:PD-(D/E)XK motif protein [Planctomycetota bacterium]